jgi:type I restriction enzyme, S subunit
MGVRPGYKVTEVGVIPQEWDVKPFRDIGKLSKGKGLLKEDINRSGAIPAIPYTALYTDYSEILDYSLIKWFIDDESQSVIVQDPCLLLASSSNMEANTGKASALVGTTPVAIGREVIIFKTSADCKFISYLLSTSPYRRKTLSLARGTTIKHVYPATFHNYQVAHPTLPEQRAIAAVLSDVDALLGALEQFIAKKRDLKQAAMQQLLTGQTRLPGFIGKWEPTALGTIGRWFSGGTPAMANESYWSGDIPWVSPKDMKVSRIDDAIDHVSRSALGNGTRLLPAGAILVVVRGMILAHTAPVGRAERPVAFNQDIKGLVVRPDVDSNFVLWWLIAHESLLLSLTNEATHGTKRLPTEELFKVQVRLPALAEQSAIAGAVSDMAAEITALEQRRDKTHLLKQGMMQELLTGRTRLL